MNDLPSAAPVRTWLIIELLRNGKTPWICALLVGLEFFLMLPSLGSCRCGFRRWMGAAVMTDAGPKVIVCPSQEWDDAATDGSLETALATAVVYPLGRTNGRPLNFIAQRGISVQYTPAPGSGYDTPWAERTFRQDFADALEQTEFTPGSDVPSRIRSGRFTSTSPDVLGLVSSCIVFGPLLTFLLSAPMAIQHGARMRRVRNQGLCACCGYELAGLSKCPECGQVIATPPNSRS